VQEFVVPVVNKHITIESKIKAFCSFNNSQIYLDLCMLHKEECRSSK